MESLGDHWKLSIPPELSNDFKVIQDWIHHPEDIQSSSCSTIDRQTSRKRICSMYNIQ